MNSFLEWGIEQSSWYLVLSIIFIDNHITVMLLLFFPWTIEKSHTSLCRRLSGKPCSENDSSFRITGKISPYATRKHVRVGWPMKMKMGQTTWNRHDQCKPNSRSRNVTYIPLTRVGGCVVLIGGHVGSARVFRYHLVGIGYINQFKIIILLIKTSRALHA